MDAKKKKGEIGELQDSLADNKIDKKKAAIRKVIILTPYFNILRLLKQ